MHSLYFNFVGSSKLDYSSHSILNALAYKMGLIILLNSQDDITLNDALMLKLKLQPSGHLMRKANSLELTLMLENVEGRG